MGTWMAETCRWLLYNKITFIKPNCILFVFLINVIQVTGCCEYCRLNKRAGPVKCVINPCPAGELLAFQGLCFTQLAVWFVSYVSQVVDKIILCKPLPRIHSKALYSPMNSESLYGETKKLWESAIDSLSWICLRVFRETVKPPSMIDSLRLRATNMKACKQFCLKVSFWYVVARTGLLDGETVAVTLHFM